MDLAAARGIPSAQVALAWMLSKPYLTAPIVGATKPQHLDDAIAAVGVRLSTDEIAALESAWADAVGGGGRAVEPRRS